MIQLLSSDDETDTAAVGRLKWLKQGRREEDSGAGDDIEVLPQLQGLKTVQFQISLYVELVLSAEYVEIATLNLYCLLSMWLEKEILREEGRLMSSNIN